MSAVVGDGHRDAHSTPAGGWRVRHTAIALTTLSQSPPPPPHLATLVTRPADLTPTLPPLKLLDLSPAFDILPAPLTRAAEAGCSCCSSPSSVGCRAATAAACSSAGGAAEVPDRRTCLPPQGCRRGAAWGGGNAGGSTGRERSEVGLPTRRETPPPSRMFVTTPLFS